MQCKSSAETSPSPERTQTKERELKHRRFANSVPQSLPLRYQSSQYLGRFAVSAAFLQKSKLPPALRFDDFESLKVFLNALLCSGFVPNEHQANLFFQSANSRFWESSLGIVEHTILLERVPWKARTRPASKERRRRCKSTGWVQRSLQNELQKLPTKRTRF